MEGALAGESTSIQQTLITVCGKIGETLSWTKT